MVNTANIYFGPGHSENGGYTALLNESGELIVDENSTSKSIYFAMQCSDLSFIGFNYNGLNCTYLDGIKCSGECPDQNPVNVDPVCADLVSCAELEGEEMIKVTFLNGTYLVPYYSMEFDFGSGNVLNGTYAAVLDRYGDVYIERNGEEEVLYFQLNCNGQTPERIIANGIECGYDNGALCTPDCNQECNLQAIASNYSCEGLTWSFDLEVTSVEVSEDHLVWNTNNPNISGTINGPAIRVSVTALSDRYILGIFGNDCNPATIYAYRPANCIDPCTQMITPEHVEVLCSLESNGSIELLNPIIGGGDNGDDIVVEWYDKDPFLADAELVGTGHRIENLNAGIYYMIFSYSKPKSSPCYIQASFEVEECDICENTDITAQIDAPSELCEGEESTLSIQNIAGGTEPYSYLWPFGDIESSISIVGTGAQMTIPVVITDANGCTKDLRANIKPSSDCPIDCSEISITGVVNAPLELCEGEETHISVHSLVGGTEPYTYLWFNGDTSASTRVIGTGENLSLPVIVTDANGCTREFRVNMKGRFGMYCSYLSELHK